LIVTADHFEEFFEHGGKGHGLTLHDEVLRVPLILWISGEQPVRSITKEVVSLIDVAPTVCDLFDVDCRYDGPGQSLLPQYRSRNPDEMRRDALAELTNAASGRYQTALVAVEGKIVRWKRSGRLVYFPARRQADEPPSFRIEPDKLATYPDGVREILGWLKERESAARERGEMLSGTATSGEKAIDGQTLRQLEALGYIEGNREPGPGD
jgi:arylsulfatase A-like enzyme